MKLPCHRWSTHSQVKELLWTLTTIRHLRPRCGVIENVLGLKGQDAIERDFNATDRQAEPHRDLKLTPLDMIRADLESADYSVGFTEVDLSTWHDVARKRPAL